jgi:UDP-N-acetylmuramoyl-L-alanyl-D-glutamate--2,6-diaminopimelate ligase
MEEYLMCKNLLFKQCRIGVINIDDKYADKIIKGRSCKIETYGYSNNADLRAKEDILLSRPGYLGVHFEMEGKLNFGVDVGIPGKFSVYNALAAILTCNILGVNERDICQGLNNVKVKGRVESVEVPGNYTLLIDYAHNAVSMRSILETLREYAPTRLVCMFGAGGNRPKIRRYEMGEVSGNLADLSVITADNSRDEEVEDILADIETGLLKTSGKYVKIPDRRDAIRYCIENAHDGDIIVLAGKGHEDYQEIKGVKYHFDEREVIAQILKELEESKVGGHIK